MSQSRFGVSSSMVLGRLRHREYKRNWKRNAKELLGDLNRLALYCRLLGKEPLIGMEMPVIVMKPCTNVG
jgi:hypothetical protein